MRLHATSLLLLLVPLLPPSPGAAQTRARLDSLAARAARDSLDPAAQYEAGLGFLRARRYDDADARFREAVRLDPLFGAGYLGLAVTRDADRGYWRVLRRAGGDSAVSRERAARRAAYRRAFLVDPFADPTPLLVADPDARDADVEQALYTVATMLRLEENGRLHAKNAPGARDSLPPDLLWIHGLLAAHTGDLDHAIEDIGALLRVAEAREQDDSVRAVPLRTNDFRYVLAALTARQGDRVRAIALYRDVLAHDVGLFMADVRLAELHQSGDEWPAALAARRAALEANPEDPTLRLDLAATLVMADSSARAESLLVETTALLPRDPRLHYFLGRARQAQGKTTDARASFETFLLLAPTRWTDAITDARQRLELLR